MSELQTIYNEHILREELNNSDLVQGFKTENWKKLSIIKKREFLTRFEMLMAQVQNRPARKVITECSPNYIYLYDEKKSEYYNPGSYDVGFITDDSYSLIRATIHEGRHAYQDDIIMGKIKPHPVDIIKIKHWFMNFFGVGVYYDCESSEDSLYRFQPVELDAFNYSLNVLKLLGDYFYDDPNYHEIMQITSGIHRAFEHVAKEFYGDNYIDEIANKVEKEYKKAYSNKLK